eukprot:scaffold176109_cov16-Tisochrysis_lutea.AAC.1
MPLHLMPSLLHFALPITDGSFLIILGGLEQPKFLAFDGQNIMFSETSKLRAVSTSGDRESSSTFEDGANSPEAIVPLPDGSVLVADRVGCAMDLLLPKQNSISLSASRTGLAAQMLFRSWNWRWRHQEMAEWGMEQSGCFCQPTWAARTVFSCL